MLLAYVELVNRKPGTECLGPIEIADQSLSNIEFNTEEIKERMRLKISAQRKPSIFMPSINLSAMRMMRALMTNRNSPMVMMVNGNVSMTIIGFINVLRTASNSARISASL